MMRNVILMSSVILDTRLDSGDGDRVVNMTIIITLRWRQDREVLSRMQKGVTCFVGSVYIGKENQETIMIYFSMTGGLEKRGVVELD